MSLTAQSQPATVIEVMNVGTVWRLTSNDGRFSGLFLDWITAVRHARREAAWHPGHVVVIREDRPGH